MKGVVQTGLRPFLVVSFAFASSTAVADPTEETYRGKNITMVVGFGVGGGYDIYARLVARHWGRHIPGSPKIVVQNMNGAGSRQAANYLANAAPRDGTTIGMISGAVAIDPVIGGVPVKFDARDFRWLGSPTTDTGACIAWHASPIRTLEDAKNREVILGAARGTTYSYPLMMNEALGTRFKIVKGYTGADSLMQAVQTGEIEAFCGNIYTTIRTRQPTWFEEGKARILVQIALRKHSTLPDIPLIMDLVENETQKKAFHLLVTSQSVLGRPMLAPPGVPDGRVAVLRNAFNMTMKDERFLVQAERTRLEIDPVSGEGIQAYINDMYNSPAEVVKEAARLLLR